MRYAMIMAGGVGSRLWPMSRKAHPKQLLPVINGRCLLQVADDRLDTVVPPEHRYICTGERYREAIQAVMPHYDDDRILGEPVGRNTLPAIGLTAAVLVRNDPDAVFAVLTADHTIEPQPTIAAAINHGFSVVEDNPHRFLTFAITPDHPATGYGYLEMGDELEGFAPARRLRTFIEKPSLEDAEQYVANPDFGWNSGMFIFHAATFMEATARYEPDIAARLTRIAAAWDTPERAAVLNEEYPKMESRQVDKAVMEVASARGEYELCTIPVDVDWIDVGSWPSYGRTISDDDTTNRTNAERVLHLDSKGILAVTDDPRHTIATIGCEDLIIIHTADATLVFPKSEEQRVKTLVEDLVPDELR